MHVGLFRIQAHFSFANSGAETRAARRPYCEQFADCGIRPASHMRNIRTRLMIVFFEGTSVI